MQKAGGSIVPQYPSQMLSIKVILRQQDSTVESDTVAASLITIQLALSITLQSPGNGLEGVGFFSVGSFVAFQ